MTELKKFNALSTGKIISILFGTWALIAAIVDIISSYFVPTEETINTILVYELQLLVTGIITGFILGFVSAYIYNFVAKKFGGIKLKLE